MRTPTSGQWSRWSRLLAGTRGVTQSVTVGAMIVASLVVAAGIVPFAPRVGGAVAQLWECELTSPEAACTTPAPRRQLGEADPLPVRPDGPIGLTEPWTSPSYNQTIIGPASHGPPSQSNSGAGGRWPAAPLAGDVPLDWCSQQVDTGAVRFLGNNTQGYCVRGDGTTTHCLLTWTYSVLGGARQVKGCYSDGIALTDLSCVPDGAHAGSLLCTLAAAYDASGRFLRCTPDPARPGRAQCTDVNHDGDARMPGNRPLACATTADPTGSVACLGSNGTLYSCLNATREFSCAVAGRNIDPDARSLSDCVPVVAGLAPGRTGAAVRCTWTGTGYGCALAGSGSTGGCPAYSTTVECAVSPADGVYNHCQDLGGPVTGFRTLCPDRDAAGGCTDDLSLPVYAPPVDHTTTFGDLDLQISTDAARQGTLPSVATGQPVPYAEEVAYCRSHVAQCQQQATAENDALTRKYAGLLQQLGLCNGEQQCLAPQDTAFGRRLLVNRRLTVTLASALVFTLLLWGLNTGQFEAANKDSKKGGLVGAIIFTTMLALNQMRDVLADRVDPGGRAVDRRWADQHFAQIYRLINAGIQANHGAGLDRDNQAARSLRLAQQMADMV